MALGGRASGRDAGAAPGSLCRACSASAGDSAGARRVRPRPVLSSRPDTGEGGGHISRGGGPAAAEAQALLEPPTPSVAGGGRWGSERRPRNFSGPETPPHAGFPNRPDSGFTSMSKLQESTSPLEKKKERKKERKKKKPPPPREAVLVMLSSAFQRPGFQFGPS